jgi:hypothetical protein
MHRRNPDLKELSHLKSQNRAKVETYGEKRKESHTNSKLKVAISVESQKRYQ